MDSRKLDVPNVPAGKEIGFGERRVINDTPLRAKWISASAKPVLYLAACRRLVPRKIGDLKTGGESHSGVP